jgi:hypothetical protein
MRNPRQALAATLHPKSRQVDFCEFGFEITLAVTNTSALAARTAV